MKKYVINKEGLNFLDKTPVDALDNPQTTEDVVYRHLPMAIVTLSDEEVELLSSKNISVEEIKDSIEGTLLSTAYEFPLTGYYEKQRTRYLKASKRGFTGKGCKVAVLDTGMNWPGNVASNKTGTLAISSIVIKSNGTPFCEWTFPTNDSSSLLSTGDENNTGNQLLLRSTQDISGNSNHLITFINGPDGNYAACGTDWTTKSSCAFVLRFDSTGKSNITFSLKLSKGTNSAGPGYISVGFTPLYASNTTLPKITTLSSSSGTIIFPVINSDWSECSQIVDAPFPNFTGNRTDDAIVIQLSGDSSGVASVMSDSTSYNRFLERVPIHENVSFSGTTPETCPTGYDIYPHGSFLASIIKGQSYVGYPENNAKFGPSIGLAPDCTLYNLSIFKYSISLFTPTLTTQGLLGALDYVIDNDIDVINCSWSIGSSPSSREALQAVIDNGTVIVAAAGNGSYPGSTNMAFPATMANVVSVNTVKSDGTPYTGSVIPGGEEGDHGITIACNGNSICETLNRSGNYSAQGGSSVAAAFFTGAFAVFKEMLQEEDNYKVLEYILKKAIKTNMSVYLGAGYLSF